MEITIRNTRIGDILSCVFEDKSEFEKKVKTLQFVQEGLKETDVEGYVALKHIISDLVRSFSEDERFHRGRPSSMIPMKDAETLANAFFAVDTWAADCITEMEQAQKELTAQDEKLAEKETELQTWKDKVSAAEDSVNSLKEEVERYNSPAMQAVMDAGVSPFRTSVN